jgi:hypothetical protein
MKSKILKLFSAVAVVFLCSQSGCIRDIHGPSDHPCRFPDAYTENDLRSAWTYKIIDKATSENLVGTTKDAKIHADSVVLMDENFKAIPSYRDANGQMARFTYRYYIDNWIFDNMYPYIDVPYNDPNALLNLKERTFYLRTAYNDIDTIKISFNQCLINPPLSFNGSMNTDEPKNERYSGYASFYFRK